MDIIEHNENIEQIAAAQVLAKEKKERENAVRKADINKMHAHMSEILTPLDADFWLKNRIREHGL